MVAWTERDKRARIDKGVAEMRTREEIYQEIDRLTIILNDPTKHYLDLMVNASDIRLEIKVLKWVLEK